MTINDFDIFTTFCDQPAVVSDATKVLKARSNRSSINPRHRVCVFVVHQLIRGTGNGRWYMFALSVCSGSSGDGGGRGDVRPHAGWPIFCFSNGVDIFAPQNICDSTTIIDLVRFIKMNKCTWIDKMTTLKIIYMPHVLFHIVYFQWNCTKIDYSKIYLLKIAGFFMKSLCVSSMYTLFISWKVQSMCFYIHVIMSEDLSFLVDPGHCNVFHHVIGLSWFCGLSSRIQDTSDGWFTFL